MQVLWGYIDPNALDYLKKHPRRKTNNVVGSRKSFVIITSTGFILDVHIYKGKPMSLQNWVVGGKGNSNFTILNNLLSSSLIILIVKYPKITSPWNEQYYCTLMCQKLIMAALTRFRSWLVIQKTVAIDECVFMCLI